MKNDTKYFELHGANFTNKGAQLLIAAVCSHMSQSKFYNAQLCMTHKGETFSDRTMYGLGAVMRSPSYWKLPYAFMRDTASIFMRKSFANAFSRMHNIWSSGLGHALSTTDFGNSLGLVNVNNCDGLIDISGYAFGDFWGDRYINILHEKAKYYSRKGKPIILLPQMFGPFENKALARKFTETAKYLNLIYARDECSLQWLATIGVDNEKVRLAPDITIFDSVKHAAPANQKKYACLVPNARMIDKGGWGKKHALMMIAAGKLLQKEGYEIVVVQHEDGAGDIKLASEVQSSLGNQARIFASRDAKILREFIGGASLLIGSRFHSIVSALSQEVPVIVMGWSHKYKELLSSFSVPDLLISKDTTEQELIKLTIKLTCGQVSEEVRDRLRTAKEGMRPINKQMWHEVEKVLFREV